MAAIFNLALGVTPESIDLWILFPFWLKIIWSRTRQTPAFMILNSE